MPRGGFRPGAGRPEAKDKRIMRGLKFSGQEWEAIKKGAASRNMSAREYISWLVFQERERLRIEAEIAMPQL